jgi:hypothetical protein
MRYEYRVIPAPTKGQKAKGFKTGEARFARTVETVMNQMAADGWEYQRAETLPSLERSGLTSTATHWRNVLVFRRASVASLADAAPEVPSAAISTVPVTRPSEPRVVSKPATPDDDASQSEGATRMLRDNGVEDLSDVSGLTNSLKQLAATRKSAKPED